MIGRLITTIWIRIVYKIFCLQVILHRDFVRLLFHVASNTECRQIREVFRCLLVLIDLVLIDVIVPRDLLSLNTNFISIDFEDWCFKRIVGVWWREPEGYKICSEFDPIYIIPIHVEFSIFA